MRDVLFDDRFGAGVGKTLDSWYQPVTCSLHLVIVHSLAAQMENDRWKRARPALKLDFIVKNNHSCPSNRLFIRRLFDHLDCPFKRCDFSLRMRRLTDFLHATWLTCVYVWKWFIKNAKIIRGCITKVYNCKNVDFREFVQVNSTLCGRKVCVNRRPILGPL